MRIEDLQAQVDARWAERDLPSWPSPRPAMDPPRDEEYSRVSDPARYRIVHERARAWTELLSELPGVRSESMPSAPLDANGRLGSFDRGTRLTSDREGTLPLLLLERDAAITDHAVRGRPFGTLPWVSRELLGQLLGHLELDGDRGTRLEVTANGRRLETDSVPVNGAARRTRKTTKSRAADKQPKLPKL